MTFVVTGTLPRFSWCQFMFQCYLFFSILIWRIGLCDTMTGTNQDTPATRSFTYCLAKHIFPTQSIGIKEVCL